MTDLIELTQRTADHLAGRPVTVRWRNPPSETGAGQVVKTAAGEMIIYVGDLTDVQSRFKVLLHELSHARMDADWIPVSDDHTRQAGSVKQSDTARQSWRSHPRELRAQDLADTWLQYAEKHAGDYWRVGRDAMTCKLLALLDWRE